MRRDELEHERREEYQKKKADHLKEVGISADALRENKVVLCPACFQGVEKDGGCNHLTCPTCHYHFCEQCHRAYWSTGGHRPNPVGHGMQDCTRDAYDGPPGWDGNKEIDQLNGQLVQAVRGNNLAQANVLLAHDADPDVFDQGESPLIIAAGRGNLSMVNCLLGMMQSLILREIGGIQHYFLQLMVQLREH